MCFAIRDRKGSWEALPSIGERSIPTWPDLGQLCNSFYDRRLGCEFNREIVSLRLAHARVRARGLVACGVRPQKGEPTFSGFSLFPFAVSSFPFSFARQQRFCQFLLWIQVKSKWNGCEIRENKEKWTYTAVMYEVYKVLLPPPPNLLSKFSWLYR